MLKEPRVTLSNAVTAKSAILFQPNNTASGHICLNNDKVRNLLGNKDRHKLYN